MNAEISTASGDYGYATINMICCGKTDFVKQGVDQLRSYMDQHNYPYEYVETEGGHIWKNWRYYLSIFAPRLFK